MCSAKNYGFMSKGEEEDGYLQQLAGSRCVPQGG